MCLQGTFKKKKFWVYLMQVSANKVLLKGRGSNLNSFLLCWFITFSHIKIIFQHKLQTHASIVVLFEGEYPMSLTDEYKRSIKYLLQQRALEELNTFVRVLAEIPRDWPRARASETPSMLIAIAKLLQIFAAYTTNPCFKYQILATDSDWLRVKNKIPE